MAPRLALSTVSLGWHLEHTIERKIAAIQEAGVDGIELFESDLQRYAAAHEITTKAAAREIRELCDSAGIEVFAYGSFDNFEGSSRPLASRLLHGVEWMEVASLLGAKMIQIPSNHEADADGDNAVIIKELQALADLGKGQDPPMAIAYEALAWGTHVADWEESLRIVKAVDRGNFGLCLDTYHVLARIWADPRAKSGIRPGGASALRDTLQRFRDTCDREKIFYIQVSDAEKMNPPILPGHPAYEEHKDGTWSWCSYGRLFPYEDERGAYLPMDDILREWVFESKWDGWVSMEVFHRDMNLQTMTPDVWVQRALKSWDAIKERFCEYET